ncbi:hevamine-A-like [Senna tora]|uniref:Hevamine-A-like n=1 Tax=Senna tora TaxID=362788 RepID=A0A834T383_9FABA|nr:hevamine-A-like [Senna tora]
MASKRPPSRILLLLLFPIFLLSQSTSSSSQEPGLVTYWGQTQYGDDGDIDLACILAPRITTCQGLGVKVFLSLGGDDDSLTYSLSSAADAKQVVGDLYYNFLAGHSCSGVNLLGNVVLDGIDLHIEAGGDDRTLYWDELHYYSQYNRFYLAASPRCHIPDSYMDKAIKTGLFDYLFVKFYDDERCMYDSSAANTTTNLFRSWDEWTTSFNVTKVYLGLPAAPEAAVSGGYIPMDVLNEQVIPYVSKASKYGGVTLWNRYYDYKIGYGENITLTSLRASKVYSAVV